MSNIKVFSDPQLTFNGPTTFLFGKNAVLQMPSENLERASEKLREAFQKKTGESLPAALVTKALTSWFNRQIDLLSENAEELILAPERPESKEFLEILNFFREAAAVNSGESSENVLIFNRSNSPGISAPDEIDDGSENLFNGFRAFSIERMSAMIGFFSTRLGEVYKTKLNKLLFYADFTHYYLFGRSVSGAKYVHLQFGPVPDRYELVLDELAAAGEISKTKIGTGNTEIVSTNAKPENISKALGAEEIRTLEWVVSQYGLMTTKEIVKFSHREKAYRFTRPNEEINYAYSRVLAKLPEKNNF